MKEPKVKTVDYYECKSCGINSLTKSRMIPCPRGGCEAVLVGQIKTTTELVLFDTITKASNLVK